MALLLVNGFDEDDDVDYLWYDTRQSNSVLSNSRWGVTSAARYVNVTAMPKSLAASGAVAIVGFAVKPINNDFLTPIVSIRDGVNGNEQVSLMILDSGEVLVLRGTSIATIIARSNPCAVRMGVLYYIEWKTLISNTGGTTEVRVNGKTVISATSLDTQVTANASWTGVTFVPVIAFGSASYSIDDVYISDGTGSAPYNDFLGDIRVECLFPQTDAVSAGSNAGLTPSTGTDHGALVDETAANADTDYNGTATAGTKDTYQYPNMVSAGDILCVHPLLLVRKTDAAPKTIAPVLRHSGTDYDGTTQSVGVKYTYLDQIYTQNPGTSAAWTAADVNALQVGMKSVL